MKSAQNIQPLRTTAPVNPLLAVCGLLLSLVFLLPARADALAETSSYRLSWLGIGIGTSTVAIVEGSPCLEITSTVRSALWTAPFYKVDNREVSCLLPQGGDYRQGSYRKQLREGGLRVDREFTYHPASATLEQLDHLTGTRSRITADASAVDPLGGTFLLRRQPLASGDTIRLQLIDNDAPNPGEFRVLRRETVTVPAGTFPAIVVESNSALDSEGLFYARGTVTVWLSADPAHRPLRIDKRIPGLFAAGIPAWLRPLVPDNMLNSPKLETVRAELAGL